MPVVRIASTPRPSRPVRTGRPLGGIARAVAEDHLVADLLQRGLRRVRGAVGGLDSTEDLEEPDRLAGRKVGGDRPLPLLPAYRRPGPRPSSIRSQLRCRHHRWCHRRRHHLRSPQRSIPARAPDTKSSEDDDSSSSSTLLQVPYLPIGRSNPNGATLCPAQSACQAAQRVLNTASTRTPSSGGRVACLGDSTVGGRPK